MAEAAAARFGFQLARRFGYKNVWLEGDAINVVKKVDNAKFGFSPIFSVYDDIRKMSVFLLVLYFLMLKGSGPRWLILW